MNTTINESASCSVYWNPTADKIGATVAYCLIFVVSLVGNSCIGVIVYKTKTLRKPINIFIVNMAMSDLLVPLTYIPFRVAFFYQKLQVGVLGNALCKVIPFLNNVAFVVSVQSLVLIAVGRFGAVWCPLRSPLISSRRCPLFIVATWIVAMAFTSLDLIARSLKKDEGRVICVLKWEEAFGESISPTDYALALHIAFLYTPIILLIFVYSIILIKLKLQKIPGQQLSDAADMQRKKQNTNALKLAISIVLALIACKLPFSVIYFIYFYAGTLPCGIFSPLYEIFWFLTTSYCAVNPCICFAFCRNYRKGLKRLLKCSFEAS